MPLTIGSLNIMEKYVQLMDRPLTICTLGRLYGVWGVTYQHVLDISKKFGTELKDLPDDFDLNAEIPNESLAFQAFGVEYDVVDIQHEGSIGTTYIFDMNLPTTPPDLIGKYDFILNTGTLEHIFHIPNALSNITKMLKVDGYVAHLAPVNGDAGHGMYQFSPCLFFDYYAANRFQIVESYHYDSAKPLSSSAEGFYSPYESAPGELEGMMGEGTFYMKFIVKKTADSTIDQIPLQGEGDLRQHISYAYAVLGSNIDPNALTEKITELETIQEIWKDSFDQVSKSHAEIVDSHSEVVDSYEQRIERLQKINADLLAKNTEHDE